MEFLDLLNWFSLRQENRGGEARLGSGPPKSNEKRHRYDTGPTAMTLEDTGVICQPIVRRREMRVRVPGEANMGTELERLTEPGKKRINGANRNIVGLQTKSSPRILGAPTRLEN